MAPRRRNASQMTSPRYRVLRHDRLNIRKIKYAGTFKQEKLRPGEEQLFSSNLPGLRGGVYTIKATQSIVVHKNDKPRALDSKQSFRVQTPCFNLTPDTIYSFYPPVGHGAAIQTLPHVVFNDSMFPWERFGSLDAELPAHQPTDYARNRVPWVAVVVFTQQELLLSAEELNVVFAKTQLKDKAKQDSTLSVEMLVDDVPNILSDGAASSPAVVTPMDPKSGLEKETAKVIFLGKSIFNGLFAAKQTDLPQTSPDVSQHRFLAHVRHVNTVGMADADDDEEKGEREFGVVVSNRTGPLDIQQPTTVIVHLVSIEGVEQMSYPVKEGLVAMSSLHSWTYTCLPANSFDVADAFKDLGASVGMLYSLKTPLPDPRETPTSRRVRERLEDGYSLVRYRVQTGEVTTAIIRGPLTPKKVKLTSTGDCPVLSTSGTDLQIFDRQLGLMDITYSTAWQLGRTLALGDQAFTAALLRVRNLILKIADQEAKVGALRDAGINFKDRKQTITSLFGSVAQLHALPDLDGLYQSDTMLHRWCRPTKVKPDLSYQSLHMRHRMIDQVELAARKVASTTDEYPDKKMHPYDEHNKPFSTDWMLVLRWILDRFYLISVPWHYLLPDPSCLPTTNLKFFHIDPNWVDALIDGGLSLANHIDARDDLVRCGIKHAVNWYLETQNTALEYPRPVPRYGCFLRSELVVKFPDLAVTTQPVDGYKSPTATEPLIILRQNVVNKDTLFVLFSEAPGTPRFSKITFAQPPHQQSFAAGKKLDSATLSGGYRKMYSVYTESQNNLLESFEWKRDDTAKKHMYNWEYRTLQAENIIDVLFQKLTAKMGTSFTETVKSSAMMGIQLNDPCYQLEISAAGCTQDVPEPLSLTYRDLRLSHVTPGRISRELSQRGTSGPTPTFHQRGRRTPLEYGLPAHARVPRPVSAHSIDELIYRQERPRTPLTPTTSSTPGTPTSHLRGRTGSWDSTTSSNDSWYELMMDPAGPPVFEFSIYPASDPTATAVTLLEYPQDLIFAVNYVRGAQQFMLQSVTISLPSQNFDNVSSAAMLSNLRFNPRILYSNQTEELRIVLFPRTRKGSVAVAMIKEMGFLMTQVIVKGEPGPVRANVRLSYVHGYLEQKFYLNLEEADNAV